jgi:hypothetical protein
VEASNTPTIRRLTPSCRHQLPRIALEAYLEANPELSAEPDREDLQSAEAVVLHAVILGISATEIDFVHLSQRFSVGREDVLDLSETQENVFNPLPRGKAAKLALKENATLRRQGTISASQLQRNLPFPFVLSSSIPNRSWRDGFANHVPKRKRLAAG